LCQDAVLVGTAGPKGLEQHKGKKKCLANIEKRKKVEKEAKTLTLFSFLQRQDKETASTATETLQMEEKQKAAIASLILVSQSTHPPLDDEHTQTMQETVGGLERENGRVVNMHGSCLVNSELQYKTFRTGPLKVEQVTSLQNLTDALCQRSVPLHSLKMSFGSVSIQR
jgi:hypothetical protein